MSNETEAVEAENQEASANENQSLLSPTPKPENEEVENDGEESSPNHLAQDDNDEPTVKAAEEKEPKEKPEGNKDSPC